MKILQFSYRSFPKNLSVVKWEEKSAMKIHKKFTSDTPYFFRKMSVVKWKESSKLCLAFSGARKINKKFTFAYPIIRQNFVRLWWGEIQNLDVVIYQAARIYKKFSSVTLIFSEKMYVVIWRAYFHSQKIYKGIYGHFRKKCTLYCEREKIAMKIHKKFTKLHMVIRRKNARLEWNKPHGS